jgi:hypothetical protein
MSIRFGVPRLAPSALAACWYGTTTKGVVSGTPGTLEIRPATRSRSE